MIYYPVIQYRNPHL
uniref:Uncharacterized protein n=1 Tax=Anguilla anguilla TaxID=7936 RepID=A0A0E9VSJ6_ANGAN